MSAYSTADPLAMARRHVEQGEHHVARQKALIAELDRDGYAKLAVEARALLTTFERHPSLEAFPRDLLDALVELLADSLWDPKKLIAFIINVSPQAKRELLAAKKAAGDITSGSGSAA